MAKLTVVDELRGLTARDWQPYVLSEDIEEYGNRAEQIWEDRRNEDLAHRPVR